MTKHLNPRPHCEVEKCVECKKTVIPNQAHLGGEQFFCCHKCGWKAAVRLLHSHNMAWCKGCRDWRDDVLEGVKLCLSCNETFEAEERKRAEVAAAVAAAKQESLAFAAEPTAIGDDGDLIDEQTFATRFGISTMSVSRYRKDGSLKFYRLGSRVVFSRKHIADWLAAQENVPVDFRRKRAEVAHVRDNKENTHAANS